MNAHGHSAPRPPDGAKMVVCFEYPGRILQGRTSPPRSGVQAGPAAGVTLHG